MPLYFSTSMKKPRTAARELLSDPSQPREEIEIENQSELGGRATYLPQRRRSASPPRSVRSPLGALMAHGSGTGPASRSC